jgi:hypothetical protein
VCCNKGEDPNLKESRWDFYWAPRPANLGRKARTQSWT